MLICGCYCRDYIAARGAALAASNVSDDAALHKKWSFLLRISSVNVTKSAVSCGFGHFYWEIFKGKLYFLCSEVFSRTSSGDCF